LTKPSLSLLVSGSVAVGFCLALPTFSLVSFAFTVVGATLTVAAANAGNMIMEVDSDRLMTRTRNRPLPSGRLSVQKATAFGLVTGVSGVALLSCFVNLTAGGLALLNIIIYLIYTYSKTKTSLNIFIGAIVGGISPLIGWAGATGGDLTNSWVLFYLLFIWQIPHVMGLALKNRSDFEKTEILMLGLTHPELAGPLSIGFCLLLLPFPFIALNYSLTGESFIALGTIANLIFLASAIEFNRQMEGRSFLLASVRYLSILMVLLVLCKGVHAYIGATEESKEEILEGTLSDEDDGEKSVEDKE